MVHRHRLESRSPRGVRTLALLTALEGGGTVAPLDRGVRGAHSAARRRRRQPHHAICARWHHSPGRQASCSDTLNERTHQIETRAPPGTMAARRKDRMDAGATAEAWRRDTSSVGARSRVATSDPGSTRPERSRLAFGHPLTHTAITTPTSDTLGPVLWLMGIAHASDDTVWGKLRSGRRAARGNPVRRNPTAGNRPLSSRHPIVVLNIVLSVAVSLYVGFKLLGHATLGVLVFLVHANPAIPTVHIACLGP
jgi:hypothetical protein